MTGLVQTKHWRLRGVVMMGLMVLLAMASPGLSQAPDPAVPDSYPPDPTSDINWSAGSSGVSDIQTAFNAARAAENAQLGTAMPAMSLPSQNDWNAKSDGEKALWLINQERAARGVHQLHGVEWNVTMVAQVYSQYLFDHNTFGHTADGRSPWERLEDNPTIGACHDFLNMPENLAVFVTSGSSISLPVERSVYSWLYADGPGWGHRHSLLWYPFNDNSGTAGKEGFIGIGRTEGGPYQGPFSAPWNYASIVVINLFDPCSTWNYAAPAVDELVYLPWMRK